MTDYEKLKQLFTEFGIAFREDWDESGSDNPNTISLVADDSDKVCGYSYFYSTYEFDENGKFVQVGIWE